MMKQMSNLGWKVLVLLQIAKVYHRDTVMSYHQRQIAMLYKAHLDMDKLQVAVVLWYVFCVLSMNICHFKVSLHLETMSHAHKC